MVPSGGKTVCSSPTADVAAAAAASASAAAHVAPRTRCFCHYSLSPITPYVLTIRWKQSVIELYSAQSAAILRHWSVVRKRCFETF